MTPLWLLLSLCVQGGAATTDITVYKVGRLIPVASEEIVGAWVSVENGKIKAFGKVDDTFSPPEGATVVDLGDAVCMPGIVDAGTPAGVYPITNEESSEITPNVRAVRLIDPGAVGFKRLVQLGVTSYCISPGSRNVIGGLASVVKLRGRTVEAMTLREDVALAAAMGQDPSVGNRAPRGGTPNMFSRRPTTRMGVVYEFRRAFIRANQAIERPADEADPGTKELVRALERKLPVRVTARRATDIETALRLAGEFGLQIHIDGGQEAFKLAETLKTKRIAVIFHPHIRTDQTRGREGTEPRLTTFNLLTDGDLPVAIVGQGVDEAQGPLAMAAYLVRYGATREAVLRALTIHPAQILGVGDRVGSIAAGRDADLLFLSGDPTQITSRVTAVMIDGQVIHGKMSK